MKIRSIQTYVSRPQGSITGSLPVAAAPDDRLRIFWTTIQSDHWCFSSPTVFLTLRRDESFFVRPGWLFPIRIWLAVSACVATVNRHARLTSRPKQRTGYTPTCRAHWSLFGQMALRKLRSHQCDRGLPIHRPLTRTQCKFRSPRSIYPKSALSTNGCSTIWFESSDTKE